ncbi:unnamed protein product [Ilex paraguariensis]|uniref:Uncharacterized protein n=1 Tax=Ilex paraguariensis TaxID=185542 RepID=A0ABC8UJT9_9AQUA
MKREERLTTENDGEAFHSSPNPEIQAMNSLVKTKKISITNRATKQSHGERSTDGRPEVDSAIKLSFIPLVYELVPMSINSLLEVFTVHSVRNQPMVIMPVGDPPIFPVRRG